MPLSPVQLYLFLLGIPLLGYDLVTMGAGVDFGIKLIQPVGADSVENGILLPIFL